MSLTICLRSIGLFPALSLLRKLFVTSVSSVMRAKADMAVSGLTETESRRFLLFAEVWSQGRSVDPVHFALLSFAVWGESRVNTFNTINTIYSKA